MVSENCKKKIIGFSIKKINTTSERATETSDYERAKFLLITQLSIIVLENKNNKSALESA